MAQATAAEQSQEVDLDQMNPFVTLSGAALALAYLKEFEDNAYSLSDFEALAEILCNHTLPTSGKSLQAKYLEWQYYNVKGHPQYLTDNLSNILMARARVERFDEAIAVLKFVHGFETIPQVEKDLTLFLQNNPKLQTPKAAAIEKAVVKQKPYKDATDIFEILSVIEKEPALFNLHNNLDELNGFVNGYKLMAAENKIKLKNMGKLDQFIFFLEKELNKPSGEQSTWYALLSKEFGPKEGYAKFMEHFNKFKLKYKA